MVPCQISDEEDDVAVGVESGFGFGSLVSDHAYVGCNGLGVASALCPALCQSSLEHYTRTSDGLD
jgi:hypothetical protein